RRRIADDGRTVFSWRWRVQRDEAAGNISDGVAAVSGHVSSRTGSGERHDARYRGTGTGWRRQHHHATGGRSGREYCEVEEASLSDGLPGCGHAEARGIRTREPDYAGRQEAAAADDGIVRPGAHRDHGDRRRVALADAVRTWRHRARFVLAA